MQGKSEIIRKTKSVCPECFVDIGADIVQSNDGVYLNKNCPAHGDFTLLLSRHPQYYKGLSSFYFSIMKKALPQRDYILHLTNSCELNCPICLAGANTFAQDGYSLQSLKKFLQGKKRHKIDIMGAEPTTRSDLPEVIRAIKESNNVAALHTNGIKIADYDYLLRLKAVGLDEVHLQFDGFDDAVYEKIRGKKLLKIKELALFNLEKLDISCDLVATIVRGVNEREIAKILEFGARHRFVKEIFFLGCRFLGKARSLPVEQCFMPDELIDLLEEQTSGIISRGSIFKFQKLYFSLLSAFSLRKCFYIHHFLIKRVKQGYVPVDNFFDLENIQPALERFRKLKVAGNAWAVPYLVFSIIFKGIGLRNVLKAKDFYSLGSGFIKEFNLSRLHGETVLLGFISACDAYSFDYEIARNCGKGAISSDRGIQDTGAIDNINRDRQFKKNGYENFSSGKPS